MCRSPTKIPIKKWYNKSGTLAEPQIEHIQLQNDQEPKMKTICWLTWYSLSQSYQAWHLFIYMPNNGTNTNDRLYLKIPNVWAHLSDIGSSNVPSFLPDAQSHIDCPCIVARVAICIVCSISTWLLDSKQNRLGLPLVWLFWSVNEVIASIYAMDWPFGNSLVELAFYNMLLVCSLFG